MTDRLHPAGERPPSLFAGVQQGAAATLGVTSLRHRSALHALGLQETVQTGLVAAVFDAVADNLGASRARGVVSRSRENWRWLKLQPQISVANRSPEVVLERAIARACQREDLQDWSNQVPVASGIAGPSAERRCAIDLVHRSGERHFQLIELKIASDTPLYAAVEVIGYACAWLFARQEATSTSSPLLLADRLDLIVLAPAAYYAPFHLAVLAKALDEEIRAFGEGQGVKLGFGFEVLAEGLSTALPPDGEILPLLAQRRPL